MYTCSPGLHALGSPASSRTLSAEASSQRLLAAAGASGAKAVQSTAAADGSTLGAAPAMTGGEGGEVEAVRLAALASMNKPAAAAPGTQPSSTPGPSQPAGVTPMLRLRPTVAQQVCSSAAVSMNRMGVNTQIWCCTETAFWACKGSTFLPSLTHVIMMSHA